jgi:hypothetical protein
VLGALDGITGERDAAARSDGSTGSSSPSLLLAAFIAGLDGLVGMARRTPP